MNDDGSVRLASSVVRVCTVCTAKRESAVSSQEQQSNQDHSTPHRTKYPLLDDRVPQQYRAMGNHPKSWRQGNLRWMMAALPLVAFCYRTTQVFAFQPLPSVTSFRHGSGSQWTAITRSTTTTTSALMMAIPVLNEWRVLPNGRVEGKVVNHPEWQDGSVISTSPLKTNPEEAAAAGKEVILVETLSGSQYLLLNPPTRQQPQQPQPQQQSIQTPAEQYAGSSTASSSSGDDENAPSSWGWTNVEESSSPMPASMSTSRETDTTDGRNNGDETVIRRAVVTTSDDDDDKQEEKEGLGETTKKLMEQVKDAGIAGVISYALWEFAFWTVSVPVCILAYHEVTGHWPDFSNQEDLKKLGAEAFAFVNVARFAVPLRIGLALSTTPWIEKNIVERLLSKPSSSTKEEN
jgi:hypothetical protein